VISEEELTSFIKWKYECGEGMERKIIRKR
jgi:hypothetical protein